jgi:hypothetical protein
MRQSRCRFRNGLPREMGDRELNPEKEIARTILVARDRTVLLDADLAALYGVTTKALNQAVKRNIARFPEDFAFRLTPKETVALMRLVNESKSSKHRDLRSPPFAFTEHGAIMLAMILRSPRAEAMSVHVVRAFASLRNVARASLELTQRLMELEGRVGAHDEDIAALFAAIRELMAPTTRTSQGIGFLADIK